MTNVGFEHPNDPRPASEDALRARKAAIRDGTLYAPPRDEFEAAQRQAEADHAATAVREAERERDAIEAERLAEAQRVADGTTPERVAEVSKTLDAADAARLADASTNEQMNALFGDADTGGEG